MITADYKYPVPAPVPNMKEILKKAEVATAPIYSEQGAGNVEDRPPKRRKLGGKKKGKAPADACADEAAPVCDAPEAEGKGAPDGVSVTELTLEELLARNAFKPPEHITVNHVYSNSYHKFTRDGLSMDMVKVRSRESTKIFSKHGVVLPDYVSTFRSKRKNMKPKTNADAKPAEADA